MALRTLIAGLLLAAPRLSAQPPDPPHVLMMSIDGLRPDAITEADRYHLKVPNLHRFVTEGTYASGVTGVVPTLTYPSHTTLVTGVTPAEHGIVSNTTFDPLLKIRWAGSGTLARSVRKPCGRWPTTRAS